MSYSSLMVHLDLGNSNDSRLQIAGDVAERFAARVIGIAAVEFSQSPYFATGEFAEVFIEQQRALLKKRLAELEQQFRSAMSGRAQAIEWRSDLAFPDDYVARAARAADLIIVGACPEGLMVDPAQQLNPSDLVMRAGRPMLVVPDKAKWLNAKHVMVGWKDTREARRAIRDALPLLKIAEEVTLVEIVDSDDDRTAGRARLADVREWLGRHGVAAAVMTPTTDGADDQLDRVAGDIGADVIVAGAYGHMRFREWVFGGVTADLLAHATCCVLLAH